ncbi:hypothetical protein MMC26_007326 [Xylographa opegraphella]|nr:hypothetical protein [Xylographa opegraphella]
MSSGLHLASANTSAAPAASVSSVSSAAPAAPAAPADFICGLCRRSFTRRSTIYLRHWQLCQRNRGNPHGLPWDSDPSCRMTPYNYKTGPPAPTPVAAPPAALVAAPPLALVAAPPPALVAAPPLAGPVFAPPSSLPAAAPAGVLYRRAHRLARRLARRHPRRPRPAFAANAACYQAVNFVGMDEAEDDTMSQGEGETAAYGPPRCSYYHYMHVDIWSRGIVQAAVASPL